MFRQIAVHQKNWKYHSALWRNHPSLQILLFVLTIVVFGLLCTVLLANRCMKQLAIEHKETHPLGAVVAEEGTYIDDVGRSMEGAVLKVK